MKILIACEFSGIVRDAFTVKGHNAWSCDLLPTEAPGNHIQDDVLLHLNDDWDMMIAHPPCDHLAVSGAAWFATKRADGRQQKGIDFFMEFTKTNIPKVCIENPVGIMSRLWRKPNQIIQPYHYGHDESKKTCLWLEGLPLLIPTKIMEPVWHKNSDGTDYKDAKGHRYLARWANQTPSGQNKIGPSKDRWKIRSRTYQGIANAMADQWGGDIAIVENKQHEELAQMTIF